MSSILFSANDLCEGYERALLAGQRLIAVINGTIEFHYSIPRLYVFYIIHYDNPEV